MPDYPKRGSHFAHKVCRLMAKVCAAQEIGTDAMLLVWTVLHVEDNKRYTGPVTFYNDQLMAILGFAKWDRLDRARKAAIEAGWLHYENGGNRKAGHYWGTVPAEFGKLDDTPFDETEYKTSHTSEGYIQGYDEGYKAGIIEGIKRGQSGGQSGDDEGDLSNLCLKPMPPPPSCPETAAPAEIPKDGNPEGEAVKILADRKVELAIETARTALKNGVTLEQIKAVAEFFDANRGKWGPAALSKRLTVVDAVRLAPEAGWPKPKARDGPVYENFTGRGKRNGRKQALP